MDSVYEIHNPIKTKIIDEFDYTDFLVGIKAFELSDKLTKFVIEKLKKTIYKDFFTIDQVKLHQPNLDHYSVVDSNYMNSGANFKYSNKHFYWILTLYSYNKVQYSLLLVNSGNSFRYIYTYNDRLFLDFQINDICLSYPPQKLEKGKQILPKILISNESFLSHKIYRLRAAFEHRYTSDAYEFDIIGCGRFEMFDRFLHNLPTIALMMDEDYYEIAPFIHFIKDGNNSNKDIHIVDAQRNQLSEENLANQIIACNCPEHDAFHLVIQSLQK